MSDGYTIYKITNIINNKIYIGLTNNMNKRWSNHKTSARKKYKNDYSYLHRSMNKYGFNNFIIEEVEKVDTLNYARKREIFWIKYLNSTNHDIGMNLTKGGEGTFGFRLPTEKCSFYGKKHTEESKRKMSEAKTGKNPLSKKQRIKSIAKITGSKNIGAKLVEDDILNIINDYVYNKFSIPKLSEKYKISKTQIARILNFKSWKAVTQNISDELKDKINKAKEKNIHDGDSKNWFLGDIDFMRSIKRKKCLLDISDARHIRKLYCTGNYTMMEIASMYNVSYPVINNIINNKRYKEEDWKN